MNISMISNSLVNVILSLLYVESRSYFKIDRYSRDVSDLLDANNCNSISQAFLENGRCRCSIPPASTILSANTGKIACIANRNIDSSKYT